MKHDAKKSGEIKKSLTMGVDKEFRNKSLFVPKTNHK